MQRIGQIPLLHRQPSGGFQVLSLPNAPHTIATERSAISMKDFAGKTAVITCGVTGMGRELAPQLGAEGCNVALCDISADAMAETKRLCEVERLPQGLRITTHLADVSVEEQLKRFRDEIADQQATDKIHLLFTTPASAAAAASSPARAGSGRGPSTSA